MYCEAGVHRVMVTGHGNVTRIMRSYAHRTTGQKSHYPPANHHASHIKKVLFLDHNHLLTTGADDTSL